MDERRVWTRTRKPSGFSCSPVSGSLLSLECRKKPRRRSASYALIFSSPLIIKYRIEKTE
jgi:hypothetical protein